MSLNEFRRWPDFPYKITSKGLQLQDSDGGQVKVMAFCHRELANFKDLLLKPEVSPHVNEYVWVFV